MNHFNIMLSGDVGGKFSLSHFLFNAFQRATTLGALKKNMVTELKRKRENFLFVTNLNFFPIAH
jgi:hypothetical protein